MNIIWGIINLAFAISSIGTFALYGLAMYAMAHGSPNPPTKSLKIVSIVVLLIFILIGLALSLYFFRNACFYFGWEW